MSLSMSDILTGNTSMDKISLDEPLPIGHYSFRIDKYEVKKARTTGNEGVVFTLIPQVHLSDVQEDKLPEDWETRRFTLSFYHPVRLKIFLHDKCKISEEKGVREAMVDSINQILICGITHIVSPIDPAKMTSIIDEGDITPNED